jgi:CopG family nickel-responsive transcriptional regulator
MPDSTDKSLVRFGVSISQPLLESFDEVILKRGYANRSEAIRDLIRDMLVDESQKSPEHDASQTVFGSITIVYDHHTREIDGRLNEIAHDHHELVITSMHVHVTHDSCLEVILVKGSSGEIKAFADHIISSRGVLHGKLAITGIIEPE